jgi:maintenance of mitochondrial morphology protein 1
MANAHIFTLQPTFTQGLIIGQLSILFLLVVVLKYLFLDPVSDQPYKYSSYQPRPSRDDSDLQSSSDDVEKPSSKKTSGRADIDTGSGVESADWINILLHQVRYSLHTAHPSLLPVLSILQVVDAYRAKLRSDLPGAEGDEVARRRVEEFANKIRPASFVV